MAQGTCVRQHAKVDSFWTECRELLVSSMALHQHIIHNTSADIVAGEERFMFTVHSADTTDAVGAVAVRTAEGMPRAALAGHLTVNAATEIIKAVASKSPEFAATICMTMGSATSRQAFADAYVGLYPSVTQTPGLSCVAMELRRPCYANTQAPGSMRMVVCDGSDAACGALTTDTIVCNDAVLDLLATWQAAFVKDALGQDTRPDDYRESLLTGISDQSIYVWKTECKVVSIAKLGRRLLDCGVSVNLVYTPPDHRGRGYSKSLLTAMCSALQAQNKRVFLFADTKSAFGTVRLYESIGFSNDGSFGDIRFSPKPDQGTAQ